MYGHLLPTIEVSRPASCASVKQDQSQFQQENQIPEVVNESTILSPTDHTFIDYFRTLTFLLKL